MPHAEPYFPGAIFSVEDGDTPSVPRVLIAPARYVQGPGVFAHLGRYLRPLEVNRPAVLASPGGHVREGSSIVASLREAGLDPVTVTFEGESSVEEIERIVAALREAGSPVDALIAVGGGKCLDTGKCVAHRLHVPMVSCPTIASNDAPCSALSVVYTPEGAFEAVEFFPDSPALVVVDTDVVARAPLRYLVSGMGDGLATWYEARACFRNPSARTADFARPTVASMTLGEACASTIREFAAGAIAAVRARRVDEALERVVEANTLLSGIGFESSGVAAAHAIATGAFPAFPAVHSSCLHGEMVAVGLLAQLVLEGEMEEAADVAGFLAAVGLPVHLGQIGLDPERDPDSVRAAAEMAAAAPFVDNEPMEVTARGVHAALLGAHELGLEAAAREGDAAYRALHPEPAAA
ncbi:MAG: glycerol dehydrogenase [Candidatus Palauibacterales bacterium]|nr:glycerol dehydrogenase [Candidatus Palauibacterales bacterium]